MTVRTGDGTINALLDAVPSETDAISLNWRCFGANGQHIFTRDHVTQCFTRTAPPVARKIQTGVKSLYRNTLPVDVMSPHRPRLHPTDLDKVLWVNGSGRPVPESFKRSGWRIGGTAYDLGQINHYAVRDAETFLVKSWKGCASNNVTPRLKYWNTFNYNLVEDHSAANLAPKRAEAIAAMRASRKLRIQHDAAIKSHRALCKELRKTPETAQLYWEITATLR